MINLSTAFAASCFEDSVVHVSEFSSMISTCE